MSRLFGKHMIASSTVFGSSKSAFAFVNLRPIVPGHVLIASKSVVPRFTALSDDEICDIWLLAKRVGQLIERKYGCSSLQLAIQDGPEAGQTVPHVHIHIVPRRKGDFERGDDIYNEIEKNESVQTSVLDEGNRKDRSMEERESEAAELRQLLIEMFPGDALLQ